VPREESGVDDTVIRYDHRAPAQRRVNTPYEIKHYSDLN
jgi:hypothetical protein